MITLDDLKVETKNFGDECIITLRLDDNLIIGSRNTGIVFFSDNVKMFETLKNYKSLYKLVLSELRTYSSLIKDFGEDYSVGHNSEIFYLFGIYLMFELDEELIKDKLVTSNRLWNDIEDDIFAYEDELEAMRCIYVDNGEIKDVNMLKFNTDIGIYRATTYFDALICLEIFKELHPELVTKDDLFNYIVSKFRSKYEYKGKCIGIKEGNCCILGDDNHTFSIGIKELKQGLIQSIYSIDTEDIDIHNDKWFETYTESLNRGTTLFLWNTLWGIGNNYDKVRFKCVNSLHTVINRLVSLDKQYKSPGISDYIYYVDNGILNIVSDKVFVLQGMTPKCVNANDIEYGSVNLVTTDKIREIEFSGVLGMSPLYDGGFKHYFDNFIHLESIDFKDMFIGEKLGEIGIIDKVIVKNFQNF